MTGQKPAFSAKEASGEGIMMQFPTDVPKLEARLQVPLKLDLHSQFINFYFGFNEPSGAPIVEAGVSVSTNASYGPNAPDSGFATSVTMGHHNTFKDKFNQQASNGLYWNVFINDARTGTVSNFPASSDLNGKTLSVFLDMTGNAIRFQVQGMPVPSIPLHHLPKIGLAKMIAATDDASASSFGPATLSMISVGGAAPRPGHLWRVNGSANVQTLQATAQGASFTCQSTGNSK